MALKDIVVSLIVLLIGVPEIISHTDPPLCSVRFEHLFSENNFAVENLSNNTFHVKLTNQSTSDNQTNQSEVDNLKLKQYFETPSKIPPVAIFECKAPYFTVFEIDSIEAVPLVEVERTRDISKDYNPSKHPDDYIHVLKVKVIMAANSTGQYVFHSKKSPHLKSSFFIFADTEKIQLLGVGRMLKSIPVGETNIRIPCVSPNPMQKIYLWKLNSTGGNSFDEIFVDNRTVFYNSELGFLTIGNSNRTNREVSTDYRCSIDHFWYAHPFVDIDTSLGDLGDIQSELSIKLFKHGGGADCYGTPAADIKFYKINANEDVAPVIVKCFEQRKSNCGVNLFNRYSDDVVMGSSINTDESGKISTSMLRFDNLENFGLLVCTSDRGVISMSFFRGLNHLYYSDVEKTPITSMLRINLVPNPDNETLISGSVLTISTNEVSGIFVYAPRIVYMKFRNGTLNEISRMTRSEDGKNHSSFLVTSDVRGVIVNDQFKTCGRTIDLLKSFSVQPKQCGTNEFKCASEECISIERVCDHQINCGDGKSDEIDCKEFTRNCTSDEFRCKSGQCISKIFYCSGKPDCFDGSDEESNCKNCGADSFRCESGDCVRMSYVCDSDGDCDDASDESLELCKDCNGNPKKFKCTKGGCILKERVCDGFFNCDDASDEDPDMCTSIAPKIVNDVVSYTYGTNEVDYLVCEVFVPRHFASQQRYQPHVNWTFFPLDDIEKLKTPESDKNNTQLEVGMDQSKVKEKAVNSSIYYFPYKFESFDESQAGTYVCTAYNEAGSTSQRFEVTLKHCDVSISSTPSSRPAQEGRPMESNMEQMSPETGHVESEANVYECRAPGKYADPDNCVQFHECVESYSILTHYTFNCGPGTVYCRDMQYCGWERNCPCEHSKNEDVYIDSNMEELKTKKQIPTKVVQINGHSINGELRPLHKKVIFGG